MTLDQFSNTSFCKYDKAMYKGEMLPIVRIDFDESLFGLLIENEVKWVRCENIDFFPAKTSQA